MTGILQCVVVPVITEWKEQQINSEWYSVLHELQEEIKFPLLKLGEETKQQIRKKNSKIEVK